MIICGLIISKEYNFDIPCGISNQICSNFIKLVLINAQTRENINNGKKIKE